MSGKFCAPLQPRPDRNARFAHQRLSEVTSTHATLCSTNCAKPTLTDLAPIKRRQVTHVSVGMRSNIPSPDKKLNFGSRLRILSEPCGSCCKSQAEHFSNNFEQDSNRSG